MARIAAVLLVLSVLGGYGIWKYLGNSPAKSVAPASDKAANNEIDKHFQQARNLYLQGKYRACLKEITKLKTLTPSYQNSAELESFCVEGIELITLQEKNM